MPSTLDLPRRFSVDKPEQLRSELERLVQSLDVYTRQGTEMFAPRYTAIPGVNPTALSFGMVARVNLIDGDELYVRLPRPDLKNQGKRCAILRQTTAGLVRVVGGSALVGGESQYQMANDIHWVEFLLDDGAYYPSRAGGVAE